MPLATQDTYAGIGINVLNTGRSRQSKAKVSVREIPGGDVIVVNNGGLGTRRASYDWYVPTETALTQLENLCGASADLIYWGGTARCVLEEIDASDWWTGGQQKARVSLIVLSRTEVAPPTLPPTAHFVYGNTGLLVEIDVNGSTAPNNRITSWSVEWGDAGTNTYNAPVSPGYWTIGSIPTQFHTYAAAGVYVVNVSVISAGIESPDYSGLVEIP